MKRGDENRGEPQFHYLTRISTENCNDSIQTISDLSSTIQQHMKAYEFSAIDFFENPHGNQENVPGVFNKPPAFILSELESLNQSRDSISDRLKRIKEEESHASLEEDTAPSNQLIQGKENVKDLDNLSKLIIPKRTFTLNIGDNEEEENNFKSTPSKKFNVRTRADWNKKKEPTKLFSDMCRAKVPDQKIISRIVSRRSISIKRTQSQGLSPSKSRVHRSEKNNRLAQTPDNYSPSIVETLCRISSFPFESRVSSTSNKSPSHKSRSLQITHSRSMDSRTFKPKGLKQSNVEFVSRLRSSGLASRHSPKRDHRLPKYCTSIIFILSHDLKRKVG